MAQSGGFCTLDTKQELGHLDSIPAFLTNCCNLEQDARIFLCLIFHADKIG